jgi:hypothetical protein
MIEDLLTGHMPRHREALPWWCICALSWRELGLVLRNPVASWHMQGLSATYVVWLEIPSWVLIDSDRRYF